MRKLIQENGPYVESYPFRDAIALFDALKNHTQGIEYHWQNTWSCSPSGQMTQIRLPLHDASRRQTTNNVST